MSNPHFPPEFQVPGYDNGGILPEPFKATLNTSNPVHFFSATQLRLMKALIDAEQGRWNIPDDPFND